MTDFSFLFLADTQLGCYATFSGFTDEEILEYEAKGMRVRKVPPVEGFEWDARQYRKAVEIVNAVRPAFVVIGGDMIDDPNGEDQTEEFFAITSLIDDDVPVHWVPGNHDIAFDFTAPTKESIDAYRAVFGPDHYTFMHGEWLFLALNTPVIDHPEHVPQEWDRQYEFLVEELEQASRLGVGNIVLFGHHPLFLTSADEPDTYWNLPLERRQRLLDLIHGSRVRIGFAGHWHRNAVGQDRGYTQVTSGPVGYPLGVDPSGYRVVDVGQAGLEHSYHRLELD